MVGAIIRNKKIGDFKRPPNFSIIIDDFVFYFVSFVEAFVIVGFLFSVIVYSFESSGEREPFLTIAQSCLPVKSLYEEFAATKR